MTQRRILPLALVLAGAWLVYGCAGGGGTEGTGTGGDTGAAGTTGTAGTTGGGTAGTTGNAGTTGAGGRGGTGTGRGGTTGSTGTGGAVQTASLCAWPTATSTLMLMSSQAISGTYDGGMRRFVGAGPLATSGQGENQPPLLKIADGATLQNLIIGSPAADGIHCDGTCTLKNVWWEDVGEDAATLEGTSASQVMIIDGGGARSAADKVFQHNGPGTMIIRNFCAQDFGKLYRSCGNCTTQYARHVQLQNVMIVPSSTTSALVGVNSNYNDTATFKSILVKAASNSLTICQRYTGNSTGAEPPKSGSGADGTVCMYSASDITWMP
jgi:pectate lyase